MISRCKVWSREHNKFLGFQWPFIRGDEALRGQERSVMCVQCVREREGA